MKAKFAKPGLKAWKRVDYVQNYDIPHIDYKELVKRHDAREGGNRSGYSLLFEG